MKTVRRLIGLAVLTACGGGAVLAPGGTRVPVTCRLAAVRWIGAYPPAERAEQDAWCAAVGGPVVFNDDTQSGAVDSIPVISWNVKVGGGDVRELVERVRRGALTGGVPVQHFVLLLQEAYRSDASVPEELAGARIPRGIAARAPDGSRVSVDEAARDLGLSLAYVPSMRNGRGDQRADRGNAILATLPLRDVVAIELPLVRQRRVAVAATVAVATSGGAAFDLQLASVHLENRPGRGVTGVRARETQLVQLLDVLPAAPLSVLGGDLNTWADGAREPAVRTALARYPDTGAVPERPTFDGPGFVDMRLDYVFARLAGGRMSGYRTIAQRYGSDHHPVMAWVHLPRTPAESGR